MNTVPRRETKFGAYNFGYYLAIDGLRQLKRIQNNKASLIVVDGPLGSGKTTLSVSFADFIQRKPINLQEQLSMGGDDFQSKLQICIDKGHRVLIYDEAGDFSKKAVMTKFNRNLSRIFDTFRTYKMIIILVLPDAMKLDNHIISSRVSRLLIHCEERSETSGKYRVFSLSDFYWIAYHAKQQIVKPKAYSMQRPLYVEYFHPLPKKRQTELDEISTASKREILDKNVLASRGLVDLKMICNEIGIVDKTAKKYIKQLDVKPSAVLGQRHYFEANIVDLVRAAMKKRPDEVQL